MKPIRNLGIVTQFPIASAVAAALGLSAFAALPAHAVHVNPNGMGQVLIYPYYTVRNNFFTALTVTNVQANTKLLKVRFLEARNGRDAFNFNLFLAPNDTWTGAVVATTRGAKLITGDNSCAMPHDLFTETRADSLGLPLNEFKNYQFSGSNVDDPAFTSLDRTREGYFEIVEMAVIDDNDSDDDGVAGFAAAAVAAAAKPGANGFPANCESLFAYSALSNASGRKFADPSAFLLAPPRGGLLGRASLIDAASGANYSYAATALDGWSSRTAYAEPGQVIGATLADAYPPRSMTVTADGMVQAQWSNDARGQRDAVSAALMRASLLNEYVLDNATASQSDWIVTLPTRRHQIEQGVALRPFTAECEPFEVRVFDREGRTRPFQPGAVPLLPPPPAGSLAESVLCNASSVLPFADSARGSLTGSNTLAKLLNYEPGRTGPTIAEFFMSSTTVPGPRSTPGLQGTQGPNGRFSMHFNKPLQALTPLAATLVRSDGSVVSVPGVHRGLPAIGFLLHNYRNAGVASRYGGVMMHKSTALVN